MCKEEKLVDTQEKAINKPPGELRKSKHMKCTPVQDDDACFSYSKKNLSGKTKIPLEKALIINDPITYKEAMSRSDTTHWKRVCAEEMKEFVQQKIFSSVLTPIGRKIVGCK